MRSSMLATLICVLLVLIPSQSEAEPLNLGSQQLFQRFVEENELGSLNHGIWKFNPPTELSESNHFGNLAYALELYRSYFDAGNVAEGSIDLEGLQYENWLLNKNDISKYFDAEDSLLTQSRILSEYLSR